MKSSSTLSSKLILLLCLVVVIPLVVLSLPAQIQNSAAQTEGITPTPSPTPTAIPEDGTLVLGDTQGLVWGAAAIVLIILLGVGIQRALLKIQAD